MPKLERAEKADEHEDRIRALHKSCRGNLVRVHEELGAAGVELAYSTLTEYCRRHAIGTPAKVVSGRYTFAPGQEMQHDTSPHTVKLGTRWVKVDCASLVLCYSRVRHVQVYPTWNRFLCKVFLTEALVSFEGAAGRCMVDNSSVVIARGTGKDAVAAPEMEAFGARFGFGFEAHALGDANRSARVERPFHDVEHNFYPGRTFADLADLNGQMRAWCERNRGEYRRSLQARPLDLYQAERGCLKRLPLHVPEVYEVHPRLVDVEGYVSLHANRYSVPYRLVGRQVEVRESYERVRVLVGHQVVAEHPRFHEGTQQRRTQPEHRPEGVWKARGVAVPLPEERALRAQDAAFGELVDALKRHHGGRAVRAVRTLHRMFLEYPREPLVAAVRTAVAHGLFDLDRIERMVLRTVAGEFFRLPAQDDDRSGFYSDQEDDDG